MSEKSIILGHTKKKYYGDREIVRLYDFKWDCDWYWAGGYIGNNNFHAHFNGAFLDSLDSRGHVLGNFFNPWTKIPERLKDFYIVADGCCIWEPIAVFLDDVPEHISENWWRIKDLFKQFYIYKEAAEAFRYGGHCSSKGRSLEEINPEMVKKINSHIENVIIPEIRRVVKMP